MVHKPLRFWIFAGFEKLLPLRVIKAPKALGVRPYRRQMPLRNAECTCAKPLLKRIPMSKIQVVPGLPMLGPTIP